MKINVLNSVEKSIETLMNDSLWAEAQDVESLLKALKNEMDEFATSLMLNDTMNTINEAGDVIMLLLCCLKHQLGKNESDILPKVLLEIKAKLYRRFSHLYSNKNDNYQQLSLFTELNKTENTDKIRIDSKEVEDLLWEKAKKRELKEKFAFCLNEKECKYAYQIGSGNIILTGDDKIKCEYCRKTYLIKESTLFPKRTTSREKIITSIAKLFQKNSSVLDSFNSLNYKNKRNIQSWITGSLEHEKALKNILEKRYGILKDETEELFKIVLKSSSYKIQDFHIKESDYYARSWDKQVAKRFILKATKNKSIEAMTVFHYSGDILRDLTIEISNMFGCPVGCAFCASKDIKNVQKLNAISYLRQVNTCLLNENINLDEIPEFQVSFAGIGEPSIVAENVLNGGKLISRIYPSVKFNIATCGFNLEAFNVWKSDEFKIRTIQIPYYHHSKASFKLLFPKETFPPVINVLPKALYLSGANVNCRVKVNYILIENYNDKIEDIDQFLSLIKPYKESITIKLSFLNPTTASRNAPMHSPPEKIFLDLNSYILNKGYSSYVFGTVIDPQIGCGQLASQFMNRQVQNGH